MSLFSRKPKPAVASDPVLYGYEFTPRGNITKAEIAQILKVVLFQGYGLHTLNKEAVAKEFGRSFRHFTLTDVDGSPVPQS